MGGFCEHCWKGEWSGAVSGQFSFNPVVRAAVYFLILYRLVRSTSVPAPFDTAQKAIPTLHTHTEVHRDARTRDEVFPAVVPCPATRRLLRLAPRSTATSTPTRTTPVNASPWQRASSHHAPFTHCTRTV